MKNVYVTGPLHAISAFDEATALLRAKGCHVTSPHEADVEEGLRAALDRCLEALTHCNCIVTLPGWEQSPGAVMEVTLAASLGILVCSMETALLLA